MSKKQIAGLVAAAIVFVFVSVASIVTNFSIGLADFTSVTVVSHYYPLAGDYVGVVDVVGTIYNEPSTSIFSTPTYDHQATLAKIDEMMYADNNKGLLLYVDSPGGTVSDSDELYLKLMKYRETTNRPIYVYMSNMACSGGYYISMASDGKVYSNRNTFTGSIGVIISVTNVTGLYEKLGIEDIQITSGDNKSMLSSTTEMTDEQRKILQSFVDESYERFVDIVAAGRNMEASKVKPLADGRIYTAKQAKQAGLIDDIMTYEELHNLIRSELGEHIIIAETAKETSVFGQFFSAAKSLEKKSDAQIIQEMLHERGNGVLMYYAKF